MGKKFRNIIKMIKNDKRFKYTLVVTIMLLFISIIGYSLSFFNNNNSTLVANIKLNDLVFNITTNSGESDDRILRLQAGKTETFNVKLTSLNGINVKYELKYVVCSDSKCTTSSSILPNNVMVAVSPMKSTYINGTITPGKDNIIEIELLTLNSSINDVFIKLDLNAGYHWNDLALDNQFELLTSDKNEPIVDMNIIAYVDGIESTFYPNSCNYIARLYNADTDEELSSDSQATCDKDTNIWKITVSGFIKNVKIKFTYLPGVPAFTFLNSAGENANVRIENKDSTDWKIYLLESGTFTFTDQTPNVDVFLVGGGGGGNAYWDGGAIAGGGGGGYTKTVLNVSLGYDSYSITIGVGGTPGTTTKSNSWHGTSGGTTSAFGYTVSGGNAPTSTYNGGNGGSGGGSGKPNSNSSGFHGTAGKGGVDGANGEGSHPGTGQGTTTREFKETTGTLYSTGGNSSSSTSGGNNTGNGGGGCSGSCTGGSGGSGIVVIRAHKINE